MIGRDENEAPSAESDRLQRDAAVLGNSSVQVAVEVDRAGAKAGADEAATPKAAAAAAPSPASAPSPAPAPVPLTSTRARIYRATGVGKRVLSPCTCLAAINVVIVTLSAGFFLYNATTIIKDYVSQLDSPPVTVRVKFNELIDFPTSMVCSSVAGLPFGGQTAVRLVYFRPDELDTAECVMSFNESTPSSDVADCLDVFDDAFFENKTVKADSGDSEGGDFHCVVWGGLPGWSKVPELREHLNNILTVDIDTDWTLESEFEPVHFLGAHYFIYGEDEYLDESTSVNAALAIASAYGVVAASTFNTAGITKSSMSYLDEEGDRVDYNIFVSGGGIDEC